MRLLISIIITFALVIAVQLLIGWKIVFEPWILMPIIEIVPPTILVLLSYLLRSIRIMDWFEGATFQNSIQVMLQHNLWNNLLPMRTGEITFPMLVTKHLDSSVAKSLVALFWFRVFDLLSICMILVCTLSLWLDYPVIIAPALVIFFIFIPVVNFFQRAIPTSLTLQKSKLISMLKSLKTEHKQLWHCLLWSIASWISKLVAYASVFSIFAHADFVDSLIATIGGELTSILPIHGIAGVGTYEAGIVGMSLPMNMSYENSLAAGVSLHLFLLSITLLTGLSSLLIPMIKQQRNDNEV